MKTGGTLIKPDSHLGMISNESNNFDAIISYLNLGGECDPLTQKQEELLERWTYAAVLLRQNVGRLKRDEVANRLKLQFNISKCT